MTTPAFPTPSARQHIRNQQAAVRVLSRERFVKTRNDFAAWMKGEQLNGFM